MNLASQLENLSVDIILPIKDEFDAFDRTFQSILDFDYPKELTNIIIVDGSKKDFTVHRRIIDLLNNHESSVSFDYIKNPSGLTPVGLNIALEKGRNPFIVRIDSHSIYPINYIDSLMARISEDPDVGNVGCPVIASTKENTLVNKAICSILGQGIGVGKSDFRLSQNQEKEVDTVPFGCFRRELLNEIGFFEERLHRNQDIELNSRIRKFGKKIILLPFPKIKYFPEEYLLSFLKKAFLNGYWNGRTCQITSFKVLSLRHFIPLLFVLGLLICSSIMFSSLGLRSLPFITLTSSYVFFIIIGTTKLHIKIIEKFITAFVLILFHLTYGSGMLISLIDIRNYLPVK